MILPTKRISEDRALLFVGAEIIRLLDEPKTVSRLWSELNDHRRQDNNLTPVTFDWFVLALDLLHALNVIELNQGQILRTR